jgi:hypothetical protein
MRKTNVHLEEVTAAVRMGVALAVGAANGGFGLVARLAFRGPRPRRPAVGSGSVAPLRVPQVR